MYSKLDLILEVSSPSCDLRTPGYLLSRTKSGFFVDKFCDHTFTDARLLEGHRASIDPLNHYMRPAFYEDNVRLLYDSANSTNTIRKGDNVYMDYDEVPYINQSEATKFVLLNPFAVVIYEGLVTLSPASDEWRDIERLPDKIITGGTRLASSNAYNWNNWSWSWGGVPNENLNVGSSTNTQQGMVNRVVSEETILDLVEDRVLQTALLPFIRSRKVHFKVQGLRPNTRMFILMDGINISAFARAETFVFHGADTTDFGNTLNGLIAHPDGTNTITSDNNGEIAGSLIIPNNDNIRFRVGTRQIKFLDISVDKEEDAGCIGRATYRAAGFLDTKQATFTSTRQLNVQGFNVPPPVYHNNNDNNDGNGPSPNTNYTGPGYSDPFDQGTDGSGDDDDGSASSGGTYICTQLYGMNAIDTDVFKIMRKYGLQLRRSDPYMMKGYDIIGPWYSSLFSKHKRMTKYGIWLSQYYKDIMQNNPLNFKQKLHEKLWQNSVIRPLYRIVGFVSDKIKRVK